MERGRGDLCFLLLIPGANRYKYKPVPPNTSPRLSSSFTPLTLSCSKLPIFLTLKPPAQMLILAVTLWLRLPTYTKTPLIVSCSAACDFKDRDKGFDNVFNNRPPNLARGRAVAMKTLEFGTAVEGIGRKPYFSEVKLDFQSAPKIWD